MIVCKYKFDSSIYNNLIPEFNSGYNGYSINDTIDGNIITRTIECDTLPTLMRFGQVYVSGEVQEDYTRCLLEILDINTSELTSCNSMFRGCSNLTQLDVSNFNTSKVTNMYCMFYNCTNLTQLDVSNFDTSNVTNMHSMFNNCTNLTQLDLSNFNTSKVINMNAMFYGCTNLTQLDVSNFDTSQVTNMYCMFYYCNNLTQLDLSNFDTSNVTNMQSMFNYCTNLTQLDLSNFNTSKVTTMSYMFYSCNNLTQLDLSNFNTSNVNNMNSMFNSCKNLTQLDISNFNFIKAPSITSMLSNTPNDMNIAMLYCSYDAVNSLNTNIVTSKKTIWVKDTEASSYTKNENVTIKDYKEISSIINLTSPLYEGDKIVVKDDKLCHYHKMGMMVLDGSEDWILRSDHEYNTHIRVQIPFNGTLRTKLLCDRFVWDTINVTNKILCVEGWLTIFIEKSKLSTTDVNGFKQWLSENPITVVYELAEPYYEDITPIQSQWVIESLEECNLDIITSLPIKVNMSYITNVPSLATLSTRVSEAKESDNLIYNLTNMLDDEINQ